MVELKTLKDFKEKAIQENKYWNENIIKVYGKKGDLREEVASFSQLKGKEKVFEQIKKEAIKHIKDLQKSIDVIYDIMKYASGIPNVSPHLEIEKNYSKIEWIRNFFNITETDLKK